MGMQKGDTIKWFSELNKNEVKIAGNKGANLSEIYNLKILDCFLIGITAQNGGHPLPKSDPSPLLMDHRQPCSAHAR